MLSENRLVLPKQPLNLGPVPHILQVLDPRREAPRDGCRLSKSELLGRYEAISGRPRVHDLQMLALLPSRSMQL